MLWHRVRLPGTARTLGPVATLVPSWILLAGKGRCRLERRGKLLFPLVRASFAWFLHEASPFERSLGLYLGALLRHVRFSTNRCSRSSKEKIHPAARPKVTGAQRSGKTPVKRQ